MQNIQIEIPDDHLLFDDTIKVHGMPWTVRMIMAYRGLSEYKLNKMLEDYPLEDILLKDSITLNYSKKRAFVDNSTTVLFHGREWTIAMIYRLVYANVPSAERKEYRLFAQQVRTFQRQSGLPDSRMKEALELVVERLGLGSLSNRTREVTDSYYNKITSDYRDFIIKQRPKEVVYEIADVNKRWYECALQDEMMMKVLYYNMDKMITKLQAEVDRLKSVELALTSKTFEQSQTIAELQKQLLQRGG